jgi:hypothetical protein
MSALPTQGPSPQARHVRFCARLIKEYKSRRIESTLKSPPFFARLGDVKAILLAGSKRFF